MGRSMPYIFLDLMSQLDSAEVLKTATQITVIFLSLIIQPFVIKSLTCWSLKIGLALNSMFSHER